VTSNKFQLQQSFTYHLG